MTGLHLLEQKVQNIQLAEKKSTNYVLSRVKSLSTNSEFLKKNYNCRTIGPTLSVSAGPSSFLPDLNTLTEISESM